MLNQYTILTPSHVPMDDSGFELIEVATPKCIEEGLSKLKPGIVALDFETKGTKPWLPGNYAVMCSLSDGDTSICLAFPDKENEEQCRELTRALGAALTEIPRLRLIAHNVAFDSAFFPDWLPNWYMCTYTAYKMLASEGWIGQSHSLKTAQVDLLLWDEKGDVAVSEWLVLNGHTRGQKKKSDTTEDIVKKWKAGKIGPDKSHMWRVPNEILGYYNCVDTYSTWHFWNSVLCPTLEHPLMENAKVMLQSFLTLNQAVREAMLSGIRIDQEELLQYRNWLSKQADDAYGAFLSSPNVRSFANSLKEDRVQEVRNREPAKETKSGAPSKRWAQWKEKLDKVTSTEIFNPNSNKHLIDLFYNYLGRPVEITTKDNQPSVGKAALPLLGEEGVLLKEYKRFVKELDFVDRCIEFSEYDGRIHPEFKLPGTQTLRLAGSGGFSVHQMPKSAGFLHCWKPDEGMCWLSQDIDALEQVVLAEQSGCRALLSLYGPDAKPGNDVYLYNGAALPKIGDIIRKAGYDPENPSQDVTDKVKKLCKAERGVAKLVSLAAAYGVGAKKLLTILKVNGIVLSHYQVKQILRAYWSLYSDVQDYYEDLKEEWRGNDGWVFDALGIPFALDKRKLHDVGNATIQRSGHLLLVLCVAELHRRREAGECPDFQWKIPDFHDEMLLQCRPEDKEELRKIMNDVMENWLHSILEPEYTHITGKADEIFTFAEAKVDKEDLEAWEQELEERG